MWSGLTGRNLVALGAEMQELRVAEVLASPGQVSTEVGQDVVVQKQTMLPSAFECVACRLKISGLSKLVACGLGDAFVSTTTLSPAEFFGLYTEQDLDEARASAAEPQWEEDFNEY